MLKVTNRYVEDTDAADVDLSHVAFTEDKALAASIAVGYAQEMILQCGAVEFKTLKDIYEGQEQFS